MPYMINLPMGRENPCAVSFEKKIYICKMWWMCNILGLGEIIPEYVKCEDQQLQSAVVCVCVHAFDIH